MRIIIRYSLNGPPPGYGVLYNKLRKILDSGGIKWTGNKMPPPHTTSTYEASNIDEAGIKIALQKFWRALAVNKSAANLDHFWMYTDRKPAPKRKKPRFKKRS